MNRVLVALPLAAVLVAAAWPAADAAGAQAPQGAPAVCEQMTPARMLENPALASEWSQALRSGDAAQIARMKALFGQIRSAHGCGGEVAIPSAPQSGAELPPGHPQVSPRLPPGHPPIAPGERPAGAMRFEEQGIVTI
jgi:hypothetical protein